ncbi:hypothetical protein OHB35_15530 [Streptomyces phaeochromogenes]|uniref:Uncharacterized protein n=1 Tax=Streptomyces phaeochromogenes TaxID=1923 RepID=A0ABZ1H7K7_STRPH|nr:hypothetical protein [Streptomyces phaeochromogenes]WSD14542.1 hypothetical protein OHB35_15530 [Streptomyces phaeochromogenes]
MEPHEAVDAVIADLRDHRITGDGSGLFTATRHIGLLCHLAARMAADAEYQLAPNIAGLPPAEALGQTAGHLGRAIAHYTQALSPLVTLSRPGAQATLQKQLDAIDQHGRLRVRLDDAGQALAATRVCLGVPGRPATPSTTASVPVPAPTVRRRS